MFIKSYDDIYHINTTFLSFFCICFQTKKKKRNKIHATSQPSQAAVIGKSIHNLEKVDGWLIDCRIKSNCLLVENGPV